MISIRHLHGLEEARACVTMMLRSEPWITLRFNRATTLKSLQDLTREVYVAVAKGAVVGFIVVNLNGPLRGYVQAIAVMPQWRNRGIGRKLLAFAEKRVFRQSPNVFLCVSSFNNGAQRLYRRQGYKRIGELKDYVVNGHSEILMRKTKGPIADFNTRKVRAGNMLYRRKRR